MLSNPVTGASKFFTILQRNASVVSKFESTNPKSNPLSVFSTTILYICQGIDIRLISTSEVPEKMTIKIWFQLPRHHPQTDVSFKRIEIF